MEGPHAPAPGPVSPPVAHRFEATRSWSDRAAVAVRVATAALLSIGIPAVGAWITRDRGWIVFTAAMALLFVAWAWAGFGLMPRAFLVGDGAIVVERPLLPVRIPLAADSSATIRRRPDRRSQTREWRVPAFSLHFLAGGGVFGRYGLWLELGGLGIFRWYERGYCNSCVLVETGGRKYLFGIEPGEPFIAALQASPRAAARYV